MSDHAVPFDYRLLSLPDAEYLFAVDGSRLYDVDSTFATEFKKLTNRGQLDLAEALVESALGTSPRTDRWIDPNPPPLPPLRSISLNVAQACNMSCSYCYADAGKFSGAARMMAFHVARAAIDHLLLESGPRDEVVVGFMGGEPLLNREVVHQAVRYASEAATRSGRRATFSITTNGTLVSEADVKLFTEFPFTVQVSIDGDKQINDSTRLMNDGSSGYERLMDTLRLFAAIGRPKLLAARATVTPNSGELLPILDHLVSLGFDEVGFSATVVSPDPRHAFAEKDFPVFLERMIGCAKKALAEWEASRHYPFGNLATALIEIHRGTHRPYPCGAGAAYLSVNAEGRLFACHRLVDDPSFEMGSVQKGTDHNARRSHLRRNHVDSAEPCRSCWARYLCGGGCYHEVSRRGRIGCDYIRGWLEFCLGAYARMTALRPEFFAPSAESNSSRLSSATTVD